MERFKWFSGICKDKNSHTLIVVHPRAYDPFIRKTASQELQWVRESDDPLLKTNIQTHKAHPIRSIDSWHSYK